MLFQLLCYILFIRMFSSVKYCRTGKLFIVLARNVKTAVLFWLYGRTVLAHIYLLLIGINIL